EGARRIRLWDPLLSRRPAGANGISRDDGAPAGADVFAPDRAGFGAGTARPEPVRAPARAPRPRVGIRLATAELRFAIFRACGFELPVVLAGEDRRLGELLFVHRLIHFWCRERPQDFLRVPHRERRPAGG